MTVAPDALLRARAAYQDAQRVTWAVIESCASRSLREAALERLARRRDELLIAELRQLQER